MSLLTGYTIDNEINVFIIYDPLETIQLLPNTMETIDNKIIS